MPLDNLKKAAKNNRLAGAYLFVGPDGIGKYAIALELAKSFDCTPFDIHTIEPEGTGPPERRSLAGGAIKINKIRELQDKLGLMPYEGSRKFALVKNAEAMTEEASNAFLKLLEEPPLDTTIILITSNMGKLLPTIISRCQIVRFHGAKTEPRTSNPGFIDTFLKALDDETVELGVEGLTRKEQEEAVGASLGLFRDVLAYKVLKDEANFDNADRIADLKRISGERSYGEIENSISALNKAADLLKQNANAKLTFAVLMMTISRQQSTS